jgi:outer membrane receptor protein involved in Fe transport
VSNAVAVQRTGNPNLVPEAARTYTAGLVFEPGWLPQFLLSVDYFQTRIDNAIGTVSGNDPAVLAECERSQWTSPVCATIQRPFGYGNNTAGNFPTLLYARNLNIASAYTRGFDIEAAYRVRLQDLIGVPGNLTLRLLYAYQPVLETQTYSTSPVVDAAGAAGLSSNRVTGVLGYRNGSFAANVQVRYLSGQKRSGNPADYYAGPRLPSITYADFDMARDFDIAKGYLLQIFVNVGNVLDQQPRISPAANRATIPGTGSPVVAGDDPMGRYYTAGFRLRL